MIFDNLAYMFKESLPYRIRFGNIDGLRLWFYTRQNYKIPNGNLYKIWPPNLNHVIWLRAGTSDLMVEPLAKPIV